MVKWLICLLALFNIARCEREEQFKVSVDCAKYGNGNYVFGCNPHYWVCFDSSQYELRCYGDLVLDPDENRCNYREKVRLCTDPNLPRSQPYRALELFSCKTMPNGLYSTGFCDNFFYSCANGTKTDNPCPYQQFFDDVTKKCDYRENVTECKPENLKPRPLAGPATPLNKMGVKTDKPQLPSNPLPVSRVQSLPSGKSRGISMPTELLPTNKTQTASNGDITIPPVVVLDCAPLPDGFYEEETGKCSNLFWRCVNKRAQYYKCPQGLFFNIENKQCDFIENVVACGGTSSRSKSGTAEDVFGTGRDAPLMPVTTTKEPIAGFNCSGRLDGFYIEKSCQSDYLHCSGGKPELRTCSQNRVFDPTVADCRPKAECGVSIRIPRDDISAPSPIEHGNFDYYNRQEKSVQASPTEAPKFCQTRQDGFYELGKCQNKYVRCVSGNNVDYICPKNLVFVNNTCEYLPNCLNPSAAATPAPSVSIRSLPQDAPRSASYDSYGQNYQQPQMETQAPLTTTTPPDMWCRQNNKPDGFHGVGCAPYFYSCTLGFSTRIQCPGGLFYDPEDHQCNNRDFIKICGGQKPPTTMAPQLDQTRPTSPPDTYCTDYKLADGYHAVGCRGYFYSCNGGVSTRLNCPAGLVFDPEEQHCTNSEWVAICGGQKTTTLPPHLSPTQSTTPPDTWCQRYNKPDGFHDVGCAPYFYSCNSGFSLRINCPGGLFYDPEEHQCTGKEVIAICGGKKPEPTTLPPMDPTRATTPPDRWCSHYNVPDGLHAAGCSPFFYSCNGGFSTRVNCPARLYYDPETQQCMNRDFIPACGGTRPALTTTLAPQMNPTTPPDTWCRDYKMPDGLHGSGCNRFFYACNGGFSQKMNCPGNLFFDIEEGQCMNREWISACGGRKPVTTTQSPQMNPTTPPDSFCRDHRLSEGYHGIGCNNFYYACNGGFSIRLTCPGNLFFDIQDGQCNHREWIAACGGQKPTTLPPQLNPPQSTTPPDMWCRKNNKADGMHSIGCSNYFYACNGGFSTRLTCPGNLYFDDEEQHCTNQEWIVACGGQRTTTLAPHLNPTMPTTPPDMWCQQYNMPDGLQSAGCKNYFYSCNGGFSTKLLCPTGLFYDPEEQQCTQRDWIPACGGQKPVTLPPQMNPTQATPPPDMWCSKNYKPDGFHGVGCAPYFYSCNSGFSLKINCPGGLFYDPEDHQCNNKEVIPSCGGKKPEPTTLPPMDATRATTPPDQWCSHYNVPDGLHAAGCSSFYYSCNGGFSTRVNCPASLFYDPELQQCTNKAWIPICGGTRPIPTTQPPQLNPTTPADTYCRDYKLSDGLHGIGCNTFFYACNGGFSQQINCPAGLYFDNDGQECSNRAWVAACGGKKPIPTTTPQPQMNPTTPNPWCSVNRKANGFHGDGCKSYFYSCNGGMTTTINCPTGLWYDEEIHQCNNRNLIVACGGKKPVPITPAPRPLAPTIPVVAQNPSQNSYYQRPAQPQQAPPQAPAYQVQPQQNPPQSPRQQYPAVQQSAPRNAVAMNIPPESQPLTPEAGRNPCQKLPNGIYGRRCSRHFFVCTNHTTFDFICPNNQAYDARVNKCAEKGQISTCANSASPSLQSGPQTQY